MHSALLNGHHTALQLKSVRIGAGQKVTSTMEPKISTCAICLVLSGCNWEHQLLGQERLSASRNSSAGTLLGVCCTAPELRSTARILARPFVSSVLSPVQPSAVVGVRSHNLYEALCDPTQQRI